MHFSKQMQSSARINITNFASLTGCNWWLTLSFNFSLSWKEQCTISNAMQCELKIICNVHEHVARAPGWANWAEKCAMCTSLIYRIICKLIQIKRICAMCTNLIICKLKMCPSSPSNECTAHSICPKEPRHPGYKQRLHVMSWTVPPCNSERKVVWTRRPLCSLSALSLIIDQFDYITLSQSVSRAEWLLNY